MFYNVSIFLILLSNFTGLIFCLFCYMFTQLEIFNLIDNIIRENSKLFLYDLILPVSKQGSLQVFIANQDKSKGINHDDCSLVSRLLDEEPKLEEMRLRAGMQVSSAGVNRKLKTVEHFNYAIDENIKVSYIDNNGDTKVISGILKDFQDNVIFIESEEIPFNDVKKANVEYLF